MKRRHRPSSKPRPPGQPIDSAAAPDRGERLQKVLAAAGLGSRRACEDLILTGRVEVDRQVVLELGTRVDPEHSQIRVDGVALPQQRRVYYALNKPMGVVTTNSDPSGRTRVVDLLPDNERVFPVGRLDKSSEGLILATNDGELTNQLTHPRYGVEKTYLVLVAGAVGFEEMDKLRRGIFLSEGFARVVRLTVKSESKRGTLIEIVLDEGRNREIRRLLARVGHKVLRLKRTAIASVKLGDMQPGEYRRLRPEEVRELRHAAGESRKRRFKRHAPAAAVARSRPAKDAASEDAPPGDAGTTHEERSRFTIEERGRRPRRRKKPAVGSSAGGKPTHRGKGPRTGEPQRPGKQRPGKRPPGKPRHGKADAPKVRRGRRP